MAMNIKEEAMRFAIGAHKGQVRKNEKDKPMVIHPISVGKLLEEYGYDDGVVCAGYLHDVVEDTKYTIEDIKDNFGTDIANLVLNASEKDKSLSWEERKTRTIEEVKNLPIRSKLVICADKINNLEDLMLKFEKNGKRDFSAFKRGEDKQKWYYTNVYKSLINNEDENLPIFKRLKNVLDIVFYDKEDLFLKDTIFKDSSYYKELKKLHAKKIELERLKALCTLPKSFVIEFLGTPRTGKTTTINNIYDYFKKGGFDVTIVEEFTTSKYYKEQRKKELEQLPTDKRNIAIIDEVDRQLIDAVIDDHDIVLIDRSINDRQVWNYRCYKRKEMNRDTYIETRDKYKEASKYFIDMVVVTYADSLTALRRDYNFSLALEKRSFLNIDNIDEYNRCLNDLKGLFEESTSSLCFIDTSNKSVNDTALTVASEATKVMRKKYIDAFKDKYKV